MAQPTFGIHNLGNTCGISTWLQCLFACPILSDGLATETRFKHDDLGAHLQHIVRAWRDGNGSFAAKKILVPSQLVSCIYEMSKGMFQKHEELDISELWQWAFHHMHNEVAVSWKITQSDVPENMASKVMRDMHRHMEGKRSNIADMVQGVQISVVKCVNCSHTVHNIEPVLTIPLTIPQNKGISLSALFHEALSSEDLDGWACDKCNEKNASKVTRFWTLPSVLILVLKRFTYDETGRIKKDQSEIDIPNQLTFHKHTIISTEKDVTYQLRSLALHVGSYHGGHYVSVVNHKQKWILCDDERIEEIEHGHNVLKKNKHAYVCVYEIMPS